jgi:hypothetical protein
VVHRKQHSISRQILGVHRAGCSDTVTQMPPSIFMGDCFREVPAASTGQQVFGEGVEQPGAGAKNEVDRRARHSSQLGDLVETDWLRWRHPELLGDGVEDAPTGFLGSRSA